MHLSGPTHLEPNLVEEFLCHAEQQLRMELKPRSFSLLQYTQMSLTTTSILIMRLLLTTSVLALTAIPAARGIKVCRSYHTQETISSTWCIADRSTLGQMKHQLPEDLFNIFHPPSMPQKDLWLPSGFTGCKFRDINERYYWLTCVHSANNHTVTQSSFSSPCQPLNGGFDSGFIYVPSGVKSGFPEWNLTITDDSTRKYRSLTDPFMSDYWSRYAAIWFYCKQLAPGPHCISGMVGWVDGLHVMFM